jgi:SPX domain protein involved in polyphosphate accumulation
MHFGRTLKRSIYPPWKDQYLDYDKIKKLLRESASQDGSSTGSQDGDDKWTDEDEETYTEELFNVQLKKVQDFHDDTVKRLHEEIKDCEQKLEPLGVGAKDGEQEGNATGQDGGSKPDLSADEKQEILKDVLKKLDSIGKETSELDKYSRINYTGFLKACKKHDRKRGDTFRARPYFQSLLGERPFHSEDSTPMVYRLSAMHAFVRQSLEGKDQSGLSFSQDETHSSEYTSHKCTSINCFYSTMLTSDSSLGPPR